MTEIDASTTHLRRLLADTDVNRIDYGEVISRSTQRLMKLTRWMLRDYSRLKRWEQTDDVFQAAVLRLYRSLSEVQPQTLRDFLGLAAIQIRRTLIDLSRHYFGPEGAATVHQSDLVVTGDRTLGHTAAAADVHGGSPSTLEEWTEFHDAVERLPPDQAEVFQLIWYAGLQQSEVANILECSVPTVQRRWYAAQISLCKALGEAPQET